MNKFKAGDKVVVVRVSMPYYWYADKIGEVFTIAGESMSMSGKVDYLIKERPTSTLLEKDIELYMKNTENTITTEDAILHLRGLLNYRVDSQIVIQVNSITVNAFDKTFIAETAESLEKICNAVNFLATQELD